MRPGSASAYSPLVVALALLATGGAVSATRRYRVARGTLADTPESFAWLFGLLGLFALLVSGEIFWADWAGFPAAQYTELFAQTLWAATLLSTAFVVFRNLDPGRSRGSRPSRASSSSRARGPSSSSA